MKIPSSLRESLERATERYAGTLTEEAVKYLDARGIPRAVAEQRLLGCVVEPLVGHDQYRDMLSVPYLSPSGVVYIKFRNFGTGEDRRYLNLGGESTRIYNVNALHNSSDTIAICEGELDTIILDAVVGIPAIGVVGVSQWKKHYPRLLEGYSRIWVFADNDIKDEGTNPGHELAKRIIRDLPQAVMVGLPRGMDVTDAYLSEGADFLRGLVQEGV